MTGFVSTRHLLTQSTTIVQEFGARCYLRCVWRTLTAQRPITFLECMPPLRASNDETSTQQQNKKKA